MKKTSKFLSTCFLVGMTLVTPVLAKAPTTDYKEIITGEMNGVPTEIEATIHNYIGKLTVDFPIINYNEDFTETSVTTEEKTVFVVRHTEDKPQVEFKMTKGSDAIDYAFSVPTHMVYGYGDIYIPEGTDTSKLPQGFYLQGQGGEGVGTKELSTITYLGPAVVPVGMNYYTADGEAFGYVTMDDLLIITEEEEENFLKTGELSEWDTFAWPGLKELLTGAKATENVKPETKPEAKPEAKPEVQSVKAKATKTYTEVQVDGVEKGFDAYIINDSNYFKLRDFAYVVNGSEKQFSVTWDDAKKAIALTSKTPYEPLGTELTITDGKDSIQAAQSTSTLYVDGQEVALESYIIDGNTYFKLREMADLFGIDVEFDPSIQQVSIQTR